MANSKLSNSLKQATKELRNAFLEEICKQIDSALRASGNGKVPYGFVTKIINETKTEEPWINKNIISFAWKKFSERNITKGVEKVVDNQRDDCSVKELKTSRLKGGRPKGTTLLMKRHLKESVIAAKNEITSIYHEKKKECNKKGENIPNGWLQETINSIRIKRGLPPNIKIPISTIRNRTKTIIMQESGSETLMSCIEPHLVELISAMGQIRRSLTGSESLSLANDLIYGTQVEKDIIQWKKNRNEYNPNAPVLGKKYWQLFKRRWAHRLVTRRGQKFALDRSKALTYRNVKKMYDDVYESLVLAGNATKSKEFTSEYIGSLKTNFHLTHPEMCLVVDEVGSNISQKGDGHIAGKKYVCEINSIPREQASHTDKHFTLLGFTALTGEPVLCLVIIAGVKEMYEVETGIDIDATPIGNPSDDDYFNKNRGKGKLFPMGPACTFNGKTIPCLVRWSQSGSITSVILRDALATIDHYNVMDRSSGRKPFLLLDGHGSQFELPFLEYITNANHKWMVCIGVPYGTSLW